MPYNFGRGAAGGLAGALGGAGTGAALGTMFAPGIGTAIGAGVGALGGGLTGLFAGTGGKESGFQQQQRFTPEQQTALAQMLQMALGQMQNPQQGFQPIADQARQQFNQQTIPGIAERFASMGQNRPTSGALMSQLGQAGAGLESQLASLGAQYGQRQQSLAHQLATLGLQPQFETAYAQREPGFGENLLMALLGSSGQIGGAAIQGKMQGDMLKNLMALKQ